MKSTKWLLVILASVMISLFTGCFTPGAIDSSGQWGYVMDNNFELAVYHIDPTSGLPTVVQKYPAGSAVQPYTNVNTQGVAVDPAGRFLYVSLTFNISTPETIVEYSIDPTSHALTLLTQAVTWSGTQPSVSSLTVDALGRFLFASDSNGGIYSYSINPNTGVLTPVASGTEYPTGGTGAVNTAVDPKGRFLYAVLPSNAGVVTMAIQGDGSLKQVGSPLVISSANTLTGIAVDRTGSFLAIMTNGSMIYTASVNHQTGALAQVSSLSGFNVPTMPIFDPTNQFLYVGNNNGQSIETLTFNATTGALIAGPSVAANTNSSTYGDSQLLISSVLQ